MALRPRSITAFYGTLLLAPPPAQSDAAAQAASDDALAALFQTGRPLDDVAAVRAALAAGGRANALAGGDTPVLHRAARTAQHAAFAALLEAGADPLALWTPHGSSAQTASRTIVHTAMMSGEAAMVAAALQAWNTAASALPARTDDPAMVPPPSRGHMFGQLALLVALAPSPTSPALSLDALSSDAARGATAAGEWQQACTGLQNSEATVALGLLARGCPLSSSRPPPSCPARSLSQGRAASRQCTLRQRAAGWSGRSGSWIMAQWLRKRTAPG
jgi:hypothetical protein